MKNKILKVLFVLATIFILYFLRTYFSEYNIKKTVSACVLAKTQKSDSFDLEKVKKLCEESIRKKKED